jgi:putative zinc finger/helix-turn-helix YgiT family protein
MWSKTELDEGCLEDHCVACGSTEISSKTVEETVEYGTGQPPAQIRVSIPVVRCATCGAEYGGSEAEDIRHEAICRHLGVLSPKEILAIRSQRGLSRQKFAELTRLGVATLARWESGEVIQNPAMDAYLRLIARQEIFQLLESNVRSDNSRTLGPDSGASLHAERFPTLASRGDIATQSRRASRFSLTG